MRTRRTRRNALLCVLISVALVSLPGAAFAQEEAETIQSLDGEGTAVVESESLGTLDEYRWAPAGIGRMFDMLIMRPMALALTGLSALTYSIAVVPALIRGDSEQLDKLYNGMIWEPIRYSVLRPPFSPPDYFKLLDEQREAEEALAQEARETALREAEEERAAAQAKAEAEAAAEAAAAAAADDKAEAGEEPPQ